MHHSCQLLVQVLVIELESAAVYHPRPWRSTSTMHDGVMARSGDGLVRAGVRATVHAMHVSINRLRDVTFLRLKSQI